MEEKIKAVIDRFHSIYFPEAKVEYLGHGDDGKLAFLFSGHMCLTCGMSDYFVDFLELLIDELGREYYIEDMKELNDDGTAWIVVYAPGSRVIDNRIKRAIIFDVKRPGEVVKISEIHLGD